jgi:UDP-N-acetylglucosamine 3-dehydrogenase
MKRVGILGAGNIARIHVAGWQALPVELVGYYDTVAEAAERFSQQYGGQAFGSLEQFLASVDIVDICTPSHVHKEHVLASARAGKAIVCEKPLARHLADCDEIVEGCEAAGVPLFVAQVVRFFPQFAKAKSLIDSGAIGKPGVIRTVRAGAFPAGRPFFGNFSLSGGVILDVGIHDIDFQRWCMGDVERVFVRGLTFSGIKERDHALITLRFVNGGVGHIEAGWASPPGQWRTHLEICGDSGMISWDSADDDPISQVLFNEARTGKNNSSYSPLAPRDNPYYAELAHFLSCLESGQPFRVTPQDALMDVKVALAAIESVRSGKPVDLATFHE